jgi:hypothetical protein
MGTEKMSAEESFIPVFALVIPAAVALKGQCHEIFHHRLFSLKYPLIKGLPHTIAKKFEIFNMHAVSMTPHAWCMRGH